MAVYRSGAVVPMSRPHITPRSVLSLCGERQPFTQSSTSGSRPVRAAPLAAASAASSGSERPVSCEIQAKASPIAAWPIS